MFSGHNSEDQRTKQLNHCFSMWAPKRVLYICLTATKIGVRRDTGFVTRVFSHFWAVFGQSLCLFVPPFVPLMGHLGLITHWSWSWISLCFHFIVFLQVYMMLMLLLLHFVRVVIIYANLLKCKSLTRQVSYFKFNFKFNINIKLHFYVIQTM